MIKSLSLQKFSEMNFKSILKIFTNKYVIVTLIFAAVIVFIDQNNVFEQTRTLRKLKKTKAEYEDISNRTDEKWQIENSLRTDTDYMENAARTQYFMKRDNEDVFIFEEKQIN